MIESDVIIIGGGPAGAACAWRLQQYGLHCLVLDKARFPRPKPCAGWVTPNVFKLLNISPEDYPFGLTRFNAFQISLRGFKFKLPTHQYAVRRIEFDHWLLTRAEVDCRQHQVSNIEQVGNLFHIDRQFSAKYLVGAGGTHCPVRRTFFTRESSQTQKKLILAKEEEFLYPYKDDRCHLWFFEKGLPGYAWYVPKAEGYLNIGIGGSASGLRSRHEALNAHWAHFINRLNDMSLVDGHHFNPLGYSYYLRQNSTRTHHPHTYLVGDSLGLATKDMGEGIGPAIQSGLLAADAIRLGNDYAISSIPAYSFPSLLRLRR